MLIAGSDPITCLTGGSYLRLSDSCISQLKAQGPSRTCKESKEEEEEGQQHVEGDAVRELQGYVAHTKRPLLQAYSALIAGSDPSQTRVRNLAEATPDLVISNCAYVPPLFI